MNASEQAGQGIGDLPALRPFAGGTRAAFSRRICKKCRRNFRVQEVLNHVAKAPEAPVERRAITCFECGRELEVPVSAQSSMCKWCSSHIDLQDIYRITAAVSRNFQNKGIIRFGSDGLCVQHPKHSSETRSSRDGSWGNWWRKRSLAIHSTAEIKGTFTAGRLIIPAANRFRWKEPIKVGSAEDCGRTGGESPGQKAQIHIEIHRLVCLGTCRRGTLLVEEGAVIVGVARIWTAWGLERVIKISRAVLRRGGTAGFASKQ